MAPGASACKPSTPVLTSPTAVELWLPAVEVWCVCWCVCVCVLE
jgi:hypothetical protein